MSKLTRISLTPEGRLLLTFPPSSKWAGYSLKIDATPGGLTLLKQILQAQANDGVTALGTRGAPTQAVVDAWLKEDRERRKAEKVMNLGFKIEVEL